MSGVEDWGTLSPESRVLDVDDDLEVASPADEVELAAAQEELEYESFADSAMTIPGQGKPGDNCQIYRTYEFCDECGEPQIGMSLCEQRSCPNCHGRWAEERTTGVAQRLAKARIAEENGIDRRAIHAVVSPPQGEIQTIVEWYDGYREAYRLAEEQGIRGGVVVGHGYRVNDGVKEEYRSLDLDYGIWRWIREDLPKSWRNYTYWSPHYHIIGLCRDLAENKPAEQDGWNCLRLDSLAPLNGSNDRDGLDDMIGRVRYILSHATFESGTSRDCVRWYGELSTASFSAAEELSDGEESVTERVTEELVGNPVDADEGGVAARSEEEQSCGNCGSSSFSSIYDAGGALLDKGWCNRIGRTQQRRLKTAFEWAIGDVEPPPGLKNPRSEEDAREAFRAMLPSSSCHDEDEDRKSGEKIKAENGRTSAESQTNRGREGGCPDLQSNVSES